jgi:hypothetical protein
MAGHGDSGHGAAPAGGMSHGAPNPKGKELGEMLQSSKPMDPNGFASTKRILGGFCTDCTVIAGSVTVVFENGTKADVKDGVYLHHALAIDATKANPTYLPGCPRDSAAGKGGASFSPFVGGAVDAFTQFYTTRDGKFPSGYFIKNHSKLRPNFD